MYQLFRKPIALATLLLLLSLLAPFSSIGQSVVNGSITGSPTGISAIGNATGWTNCFFSPDLCNTSFPSFFGGSAVGVCASPDGGSWLGLAANGECASTTITGLTPGQDYTLFFCGACFGTGFTHYNQSPAQPTITIGTATYTPTIPMAACTWNGYSILFTADSSTMVLRIQHMPGTDAYALLDGFSLSNPSCAIPLDANAEGQIHSFSATFQNCQAKLRWSIQSPETLREITVERAGENGIYVPIWQPAVSAEGFTDPNPLKAGYYRLKTEDKDGKVAQTRAVYLEGNCTEPGLEVAQTETGGRPIWKVRVREDQLQREVRIFDLNGKLMWQAVLEAEVGKWAEIEVEVDQWAVAMYVVVAGRQRKKLWKR
ncbi:MAG: hypothetical protein AAF570_12575 [Bacteroidota bacterium]